MSGEARWPPLRRNLVAILRGVKPAEIEAIGEAVREAGIEAIEVPLNSPEPFRSIETLVRRLPSHVLVGAGTVLAEKDVDRLADCGGRLMVSPNLDAGVMARAHHHGLVTMPGVFTPTEALAGIAAGASALKFFPASVLGPGGIAAIRAVLPTETMVGAVGGISETDFGAFARAGVRAFGLGSSLYRPGDDAAPVRARAVRAVAAWDEVFAAAS